MLIVIHLNVSPASVFGLRMLTQCMRLPGFVFVRIFNRIDDDWQVLFLKQRDNRSENH
jgi:hypothetical protein